MQIKDAIEDLKTDLSDFKKKEQLLAFYKSLMTATNSAGGSPVFDEKTTLAELAESLAPNKIIFTYMGTSTR
jgi:hypothetical protein